jgi:hypothetical protein
MFNLFQGKLYMQSYVPCMHELSVKQLAMPKEKMFILHVTECSDQVHSRCKKTESVAGISMLRRLHTLLPQQTFYWKSTLVTGMLAVAFGHPSLRISHYPTSFCGKDKDKDEINPVLNCLTAEPWRHMGGVDV